MNAIPTVTVNRDGQNVRINADEYDAERDGEFSAADEGAQAIIDAAQGSAPMARTEDLKPQPTDAPTQLVAGNVEQPLPVTGTAQEGQDGTDAAQDAEMTSAPATEPQDDAAPVATAVVKRGRKFFATDAQGNDVKSPALAADGYSKEQDAWDAILKAGQNG